MYPSPHYYYTPALNSLPSGQRKAAGNELLWGILLAGAVIQVLFLLLDIVVLFVTFLNGFTRLSLLIWFLFLIKMVGLVGVFMMKFRDVFSKQVFVIVFISIGGIFSVAVVLLTIEMVKVTNSIWLALGNPFVMEMTAAMLTNFVAAVYANFAGQASGIHYQPIVTLVSEH